MGRVWVRWGFKLDTGERRGVPARFSRRKGRTRSLARRTHEATAGASTRRKAWRAGRSSGGLAHMQAGALGKEWRREVVPRICRCESKNQQRCRINDVADGDWSLQKRADPLRVAEGPESGKVLYETNVKLAARTELHEALQ